MAHNCSPSQKDRLKATTSGHLLIIYFAPISGGCISAVCCLPPLSDSRKSIIIHKFQQSYLYHIDYFFVKNNPSINRIYLTNRCRFIFSQNRHPFSLHIGTNLCIMVVLLTWNITVCRKFKNARCQQPDFMKGISWSILLPSDCFVYSLSACQDVRNPWKLSPIEEHHI